MTNERETDENRISVSAATARNRFVVVSGGGETKKETEIDEIRRNFARTRKKLEAGVREEK